MTNPFLPLRKSEQPGVGAETLAILSEISIKFDSIRTEYLENPNLPIRDYMGVYSPEERVREGALQLYARRGDLLWNGGGEIFQGVLEEILHGPEYVKAYEDGLNISHRSIQLSPGSAVARAYVSLINSGDDSLAIDIRYFPTNGNTMKSHVGKLVFATCGKVFRNNDDLTTHVSSLPKQSRERRFITLGLLGASYSNVRDYLEGVVKGFGLNNDGVNNSVVRPLDTSEIGARKFLERKIVDLAPNQKSIAYALGYLKSLEDQMLQVATEIFPEAPELAREVIVVVNSLDEAFVKGKTHAVDARKAVLPALYRCDYDEAFEHIRMIDGFGAVGARDWRAFYLAYDEYRRRVELVASNGGALEP